MLQYKSKIYRILFSWQGTLHNFIITHVNNPEPCTMLYDFKRGKLSGQIATVKGDEKYFNKFDFEEHSFRMLLTESKMVIGYAEYAGVMQVLVFNYWVEYGVAENATLHLNKSRQITTKDSHFYPFLQEEFILFNEESGKKLYISMHTLVSRLIIANSSFDIERFGTCLFDRNAEEPMGVYIDIPSRGLARAYGLQIRCPPRGSSSLPVHQTVLKKLLVRIEYRRDPRVCGSAFVLDINMDSRGKILHFCHARINQKSLLNIEKASGNILKDVFVYTPKKV
jgi:hypothetical protein